MHPVRTRGAHTPVVLAVDLIGLIVDGDGESTREYLAEVFGSSYSDFFEY